MRRDIKVFIASCQVCQQMKDHHHHPAGLLQPLPIPEQVFEEITMDFVTCLPPSRGKTTIMAVVDRLSKYGHFVPLPATFTALTVAEAFIAHILKLHGPPKSIVTDRDPRFLHGFWQELHRLQGTSLAMSTAYHPQMDSQSEALNKCVEQYLHCYVADSPSDWVSMLPWAEYWYNTSFQTSAGMSPFQALYGRAPPTLARYVIDGSSHELVEQFFLHRDEVLHSLKANLLRAQGRMKKFADQKRTHVTLEAGDWAYVKLQPYKQHSLRLHKHHKLDRKYFGPFKVLRRIGSVAYKLELPVAASIHPVFHISLLKKCIGLPEQQITPLNLSDTSTIAAGMNLVDKVPFGVGGYVMNSNSIEITHTPSRDSSQVSIPQVTESVRRSTRVRKYPTKLTDFV